MFLAENPNLTIVKEKEYELISENIINRPELMVKTKIKDGALTIVNDKHKILLCVRRVNGKDIYYADDSFS